MDEEAGSEAGCAAECVGERAGMKGRNVWCFPVPIPREWVSNEVIREQIERACKGSNEVPEFVKQHIKEEFVFMRTM